MDALRTSQAHRRPASLARVVIAAFALAHFGAWLAPPAVHALPPPILTGYVPLPAQDLATTLETINSAANSSQITFIVGISNAASGAIIVYDHWEDGYEADPANPAQASTLVFGDGNAANGDAASFCANPAACAGDLLPAGAVLVFRNDIAIPRTPAVIRFDGRDKITSTRAFSITGTGYPISPGSLFGDAVATYDTTRFGTRFVMPIGENTPTPAGSSPPFDYTGATIMASQNGTVVQVDADADGIFELTQTIDEGETVHVDGGLLQGARIATSKPAQVAVLTGGRGDEWEARYFELFPTALLSDDYLNPAGSPEANQETILYLWNPNPSAITITPTCAGCAGTIPLAANSGASYTVPLGQGVQLTSVGGVFLAVGAVGAQSGAGGGSDNTAVHDWGFSLVPTSLLTWQAVIGYAPGDSGLPPTNADWSPVWITTPTDTTLYVKFDGDPTTGPSSTPAGCPFPKYDLAIPVTALASTRIDDPSDSDMTGAIIFTCDFTKIAGAWGQDPSQANAGSPAFDAGWTLFPTTWIVVDKTASQATDVNGDGLFNPGDTIRYAVKVSNAGFADLTNVVMTDTLPAGVAYVPNSSELVQGMVVTPIPDSGATPFPFDEGGTLLPTLTPGDSYVVRFSAIILDPYAGPPDMALINQVEVTADQDRGLDRIDTLVVVPPPTVGSITVDKVTSPPGNPRLFEFTLAGGPTPINDVFTLADSTAPHTVSPLEPGTYTITEAPAAGFTISVTCTGGPFGEGTTYTNGASFTIAAGATVNCTFTNTLRPTAGFCPNPSTAKIITAAGTGRWPGNKGMDVVVRTDLGELVQDAIDNAADYNADGYILIGVQGKTTTQPGGFGTQRVVIDDVYTKPFGLIGCTTTLFDPGPQDGLPVFDIRASATAPSFFVMGLTASTSSGPGWRVAGNGRYLYSLSATSTATGMWITGNGNTVNIGTYSGNNGVGILVEGNGNTVWGPRLLLNSGHGIQVVGNSNTVERSDVGDLTRGNGGDGVNVSGRGNVVRRNLVFANGGDGIEVTGGTAAAPNVIAENLAGDRSKGNGGHGIFVFADVGSGNGGTIEIDKNTVRANALDGIHLGASATGHDLRNNVSGGTAAQTNGDCEFNVAAGNFNRGSNKANAVTVAGALGSPFPVGCLGTP